MYTKYSIFAYLKAIMQKLGYDAQEWGLETCNIYLLLLQHQGSHLADGFAPFGFKWGH